MSSRQPTFIAGLAAMLDQPPPPCEKYACRHFKRCSQWRLACSAFVRYVIAGADIRPTAAPTARIYQTVFPANDSPSARGGAL